MCCFISLPISGSLAPQVLYLALYLLSWPQWQAPAVALPQALAGLQLAPGAGVLIRLWLAKRVCSRAALLLLVAVSQPPA